MAKLLKVYETDTDFSVCLYQSGKNMLYIVTTHDNVMRNHFDYQYYKKKQNAVKEAKERVRQYRLN